MPPRRPSSTSGTQGSKQTVQEIGNGVLSFAVAGNGDVIMLNTANEVLDQWNTRP